MNGKHIFIYNITEGCRILLQSIVGLKIFTFPGLYFFRWLVFHCCFGAPRGVIIGSGCMLQRQHKMSDGYVKISKGCMIADNVQIDYSGGLIMEDNTTFSESSIVLTHNHEIFSTDWHQPFATPLVIRKYAWVGAGCVILPGVSEIGESAMVQAGCVVGKKVKPRTIVGGNPMKTIGIIPEWLTNE